MTTGHVIGEKYWMLVILIVCFTFNMFFLWDFFFLNMKNWKNNTHTKKKLQKIERSHGFQIHLRALQLYKGASQRRLTLAHPKTFTQHCVNIYWKSFTLPPCKCRCKKKNFKYTKFTLACTTLHLTLARIDWAWLACSGAILVLGFSQFV